MGKHIRSLAIRVETRGKWDSVRRLRDWMQVLLISAALAFGLVACNGGNSMPMSTSPTITSLTPNSGARGTAVTITGTNFGTTQGTSTVTFNGVAASPTSWSATSIAVPVPSGATTGNVVVTVGGVASNGVSFTVTTSAPTITSANSTTFTVGAAGSFTVTATGVPTPSLTETGALPSGVTFKDNGNGTATLSGIPASGTGGTYPITIKAHNGVGADASQSFKLTVKHKGSH